MIDPNEIRAAFRKIADRYEGRSDAIGSLRADIAEAALSHIELLEAERASCTCERRVGFEIPQARCDAIPYMAMERAAVERMQERA